MTNRARRSRLKAAFLLAGMAFVAGASAPAPAAAQAGIGSIALTPTLVEGLIASLPVVRTLSDTLRARYNIPDGGGAPGTAFGAMLAFQGAMGDLNGAVAPYGFENFGQWVQALAAAATAVAWAENGGADAQIAQAIQAIRDNPNIPAAQKEMMVQMVQSQAGALAAVRPSPENLAAVAPYAAQLRAVLEN